MFSFASDAYGSLAAGISRGKYIERTGAEYLYGLALGWVLARLSPDHRQKSLRENSISKLSPAEPALSLSNGDG